MWKSLVALAALSCAAVAPANTFTVTGALTIPSSGPSAVGDRFTATISYDDRHVFAQTPYHFLYGMTAPISVAFSGAYDYAETFLPYMMTYDRFSNNLEVTGPRGLGQFHLTIPLLRAINMNSPPLVGELLGRTGSFFYAIPYNSQQFTWIGGSGNITVTSAVPEPASWALMVGGIGLIGGTMRRRTTADNTVPV